MRGVVVCGVWPPPISKEICTKSSSDCCVQRRVNFDLITEARRLQGEGTVLENGRLVYYAPRGKCEVLLRVGSIFAREPSSAILGESFGRLVL
jgi:hypothetical protein